MPSPPKSADAGSQEMGPPQRSSQQQVVLPAAGLLSETWLENALAAERASLVSYLEQRHQALLLDLKAQIRGEYGEAPEGVAVHFRTTSANETDPQSNMHAERCDAPEVTTTGGGGEGGASEPGGAELSAQDPEVLEGTAGGSRAESADEAGGAEAPPAPCLLGVSRPRSSPKDADSPQGEADAGEPALALQEERAAAHQRAQDDYDCTSPMHSIRSSSDLTEVSNSHSLFHDVADKDSACALAKVVRDAKFELAMACVIMANAIVMAFEIQRDGMSLGNHLGYRWYSAPGEETWRGSTAGVNTMDYIFGVIFAVELVVKVLGWRAQWFCDPWNYLDAAIVSLWLIETPLQGTLQLPTDAHILRLARLLRVLRLLRLLRTIHGFDDLYLLLTTLKGSMLILGWSCILLFFTQMLIAMIFWFILKETYFFNDYYPLDERQQVFEYFGTFTRTMLTMFEMTLANWPPVCRLLVENVNEWFSLFCILHKLTMGFAVIGAINGVVIQETFKAAATDDRVMIHQREREVKVHTGKLLRFFQAADESGDGIVDRDEFRQIMQNKEIFLWLSSMDITIRDPDALFTLLDADADDELTSEELIKGILELKGGAKSIDMLSLKTKVEHIASVLNQCQSLPTTPHCN